MTKEDQDFLDAYDPTEYDHPSVAVDIAILTTLDSTLRAVVRRRNEPPQRGLWSLPGGFVGMDESLEAAATRILRRKVGLAHVFLEQLYTFGEPRRDPRTRVISVAYYALVDAGRLQGAVERAGDDLAVVRVKVPWEGETGGPVEVADAESRLLPLAFDHADILGMAVKRLRGKLDYTPIGFQLLADRFTLRQLQEVHETILHRPLNKDSFRRRMLASGLLEATGDRERGVEHRPAELYRFIRRSAV